MQFRTFFLHNLIALLFALGRKNLPNLMVEFAKVYSFQTRKLDEIAIIGSQEFIDKSAEALTALRFRCSAMHSVLNKRKIVILELKTKSSVLAETLGIQTGLWLVKKEAITSLYIKLLTKAVATRLWKRPVWRTLFDIEYADRVLARALNHAHRLHQEDVTVQVG